MKIDEALCPCESGKLIKDCCLDSTGILWPKPFIPQLSRPRTYIKNPKCYAAELEDCSEKMSREHYISHAVLKEVSEDGVTVEAEGLSWLKDDEMKKVSTQNLRSHVLCKRHNEALSGFDTVAKRFFSAIDRIDKGYGVNGDQDGDKIFLFNGNDIERWMMKTLCGLVSSGNSSSQSGFIRGWKPNIQWLKMLFAQERFPLGWGLYFAGIVDQVTVVQRGFQFAPISNNTLGVYGSITILNDKKMVLAMISPPTRTDDNILTGHIYRPEKVVMTNGKTTNVIAFGWDLPGRGGSIVIQYGVR